MSFGRKIKLKKKVSPQTLIPRLIWFPLTSIREQVCFSKYRIRPNYRTVRLGFSKLLGALNCCKIYY